MKDIKVHLVGPKNRVPASKTVLNVTSQSTNWGKELSPFTLGPINLYQDYISENMENAWQFTKVYPQHVDDKGRIKSDYWRWAKAGWRDKFAHRYPMGKGAEPLYCLWDQKTLPYIDARKQIYIPLYAGAAIRTPAFKRLQTIAETLGEIYLWDFDVYDHRSMNMTYQDVINCKTMKCGHGFVLAMLLELGQDRTMELCGINLV